ncbi:MAG TPA: SAM-dependent methyltransferase [Lacipirellulaceae bacterium]
MSRLELFNPQSIGTRLLLARKLLWFVGEKMAVSPQFVFMTCRPGAEPALKQELTRTESTWRLSFSRPGFVTFKVPDSEQLDDAQLAARNWTFARTHGISLGRVTGQQMGEIAQQMWQLAAVAAMPLENPIADVHVWERQPQLSNTSAAAGGSSSLPNEIETAIRAAAPPSFAHLQRLKDGPRRPTSRNVRVLDVVVVAPGEWWIGSHLAVTHPQRYAGGAIPVALPTHAVSRAYAKLEEALAWSDLPIEAGDECVEIGCAPGGASQALLDRGLFVTGIDPAEVDPAVLAHPRFRHLRKRSKEVRRGEFAGVRWLTADVNLAPSYTLDTVEAIVNHPDVAIRGLVLTLKLANWTEAERLPEFAARVRGWGYRDVRLRQLATGGQEVCLVALRRRELRRLNRKRKPRRAVTPEKVSGVAEPASAAMSVRHDPPHLSLSGPHF